MEEMHAIHYSEIPKNATETSEFNSCSFLKTKSGTQDSNDNSGLFLCPLVRSNLVIGSIYCILTCIIIVVGTAGNVFILWVSLSKKSRRKTGTVFTVYLASGNLCIACVAEPLCLVGAIYGEEWFNQNFFVCEAVACMCFTACMGTYFTLILHILDRYMFICHNMIYVEFMTILRASIICFLFWLAGFLLELGNFIGWNEHHFDPKTHRCMWNRNKSMSFKFTLAGCLVVPFIIAVVSFVLIYREIFIRRRDVYKFSVNQVQNRNKRAFRDTLTTSRRLLLNLLTFILCWAPAGSLVFIDLADKVGMEAYLFTMMLAHFHACSDFFVSLGVDKTSRSSMRRLLSRTERMTSLNIKHVEIKKEQRVIQVI